MTRTTLVALFATAAVFAACSGVADAQSFPTRPVILIVPWPAGGATDVQLRALAAASEKHLGQPIVIENRPGASATLGPIHMAATLRSDAPWQSFAEFLGAARTNPGMITYGSSGTGGTPHLTMEEIARRLNINGPMCRSKA